jgi:MraZ protein
MILLTGEYELTLDEKYRLFIPAKVRQQIDAPEEGDDFYLIFGVNRILSLYPEKYYKRIALAVAPGTAAPDETLAYERVHYALAGKVELDRQGRVLIGEKAVHRAGLKSQVTLIGVRDHLEVWDAGIWEKYLEEHLGLHEQMLLQAREEAYRRERQQAGW